jgi:hypothetical protein
VIDLGQWRLLAVFIVGLVGAIAFSEFGRALVRRQRVQKGTDLDTLETAVLAILALMIGFTFAMALSRFDARRDALMNEANAIGTSALRARLLPSPYSEEITGLLREYGEIRLSAVQNRWSGATLQNESSRLNQIREALWVTTKKVAETEKGIVPVGIFIQAVNEMLDSQGRHSFALESGVPNAVFWALYVIGAIAFLFVGYANRLQAQTLRLPVYVMAAMVSGLIVLIQDLDRPTVGFINVNQAPMVDAVRDISESSSMTIAKP